MGILNYIDQKDINFLMALCAALILNILLIADMRGRGEKKRLDWIMRYVKRQKKV
jgi:hypothetical protein